MKKLVMALSILAMVSCKFDQNGNKDVLPETKATHETGAHGHDGGHGDHSDQAHDESAEHSHGEEVAHSHDTEASHLDANGNYVYDLGEIIEITLPSGKVIKAGKLSSENKLYTQLSGADFAVSDDKSQGWITLDRVYFMTGKDELTPESKEQISNVVEIMKAFPTAELKLGGYTDNTGSAEGNKKLSGKRAASVMGQIVTEGVEVARMKSEGYGAEHPICPANDTDECRAQNRRVDLRVTKK